MTKEEFNQTSFGAGDKAIYQGEEYPIASVDFEEQLIGLVGVVSGADEDHISWVRCENCEVLSAVTQK